MLARAEISGGIMPPIGAEYFHRSLFVKMPNVAKNGPLWDYL